MKKFVSKICILAILTNFAACGTILHPERKGQTGAGQQLDVSIVLLDGIGLIFFLVPGVIAYAVDFTNGTIYLPGRGYRKSSIEDFNKENMVAVNVGKENLNSKKINEVIHQAGFNVNTKDATAYKIDKNGQKVKVSL